VRCVVTMGEMGNVRIVLDGEQEIRGKLLVREIK
jgi:hypothetical protein